MSNIKISELPVVTAGSVLTGKFPLVAGATTSSVLGSEMASSFNSPTTDEKTRLSDIQAATGATTALKLANLASPASTTQQGVALLGASGGATKLTKMPDGATAVYASNFATTDGWLNDNMTLSVSNGVLRATANSSTTCDIYRNIAGIAGKAHYLKIRTSKALSLQLRNSSIVINTISGTADWRVVFCLGTAVATQVTLLATMVANDWFEIKDVWIGDYSYLTGSLSEEAARIADQLGDTPGVGVAASATMLSNGTDVSVGDNVTFAGKTYTFVESTTTPTVEGQVQRHGTDPVSSLLYLVYAITRFNPASFDGVLYKIAAAHPLVTASRTSTLLTITALSPGVLGNSITIAKSATTLTLSGTTLTGGIDDVGAKASYQVARSSSQLAAKTSGVAADYEMLLDSADGFIKKKVLKSNLETATQTAGKRVLFNAAKGINVDGISFPATQVPSADANTLDDYEEGSWTPGVAFDGGATGVAYDPSNAGTYVKLGRKVRVKGLLNVTTKPSSTGNATITGLPFTRSSPVSDVTAGTCSCTGLTVTGLPALSISPSVTIISINALAINSGVSTQQTDAAFAAQFVVRIDLEYFV